MTKFDLPEGLYGPVCTVVSIAICSLLVFVIAVVQWFNVRMAILAPIVASLCYGSSISAIQQRCSRNLFGTLIGGGMCLLWLVILRACAQAISGTRDYDQYIAVACTLPWLLMFFTVFPREVVSLSTTCLLFLTLTMYCGDYESPDAFPLRAMLAGACGAIVSFAVALIFDRIGMKRVRENPEGNLAESALWEYWDLLLQDSVVGFSSKEAESRKVDCMEALSLPHIPKSIGEKLVAGFGNLCALHSLISIRSRNDGFFPGQVCACLNELQSRRMKGSKTPAAALDKLAALANEAVDKGSRSTSTIRLVAMIPAMRAFIGNIDSGREISQRETESTFWNDLKESIKVQKVSWLQIYDGLRFAAVMVSLSMLLVFWDARDDTVDTYALWAFVPALLLAERVIYVGQAIVDGLRYTLSAFLGSGLGVLALLMNDGRRVSYLAEFSITVIIGLAIQARKPKWGDTGIVLIVAWMICVLGNYGLDPLESGGSASDSGGLNTLWRCALYRSAITCFSVFFMGFMFVILPTRFASSELEFDTFTFVSSIARDVSKLLSGSDQSHSDDATVANKCNDKIEEVTFLQKHLFVTQSITDRLRYSRAECTRHRHTLVDKTELGHLWASFCGFERVSDSGNTQETLHMKWTSSLVEAMRALARELEALSTPHELMDADVSLIKPRARQLRIALDGAIQALASVDLTADSLLSDGIISLVSTAICLRDFLRRWVKVEEHIGLHEEFDGPTDLRDNSEDEVDVDVYV